MKNTGIALVFVGILIVFYGIFFSVRIFVQEEKPPQLFAPRDISLNEVMGVNMTEEEMIFSEEVKIEDVFPVAQLLNTTAVSIFSMLLFLSGGKVAGIGISIIKN